MDQALLDILCCPATRQPLRPAGDRALAAAARLGRPLREALLREDGRVLYPVMNGIPLLLVEEGVPIV